jgi:hypothetical protein
MELDTKTYWLTDRQSQCNFDFDFDIDFLKSSRELSVADSRGRFVVKMKNWRVIIREDLYVIVEV